MSNPITRAVRGTVEGQPRQQQQQLTGSETALLDALITHGLQGAQGTPEMESATPLEGYPALPNPDPNSPPPLYGEPPGEGYLFARDPQFRQASLVFTDVEIVRTVLLRAMETLAWNAQLPFNQEGAQKNADAILKLAQAYLLVDPSVDAQGVPVATTAATALLSAGGQPQPPEGKPGEASGTVKKGPNVGGHAQPPKVVPGPKAEAEAAAHEHVAELLKGSRGSRPLPQPRPNA